MATHIPGIFNKKTDIESRKHETRTEWMTKQKYFEKIIKCLNFKQTVDLLAISLNTQLPHFVSLTHFISFMKKPVILCFPAIHLYP